MRVEAPNDKLTDDEERAKGARIGTIALLIVRSGNWLGIPSPFQDPDGNKNNTESNERYHRKPKQSRLIGSKNGSRVVILSSKSENTSTNDRFDWCHQKPAADKNESPSMKPGRLLVRFFWRCHRMPNDPIPPGLETQPTGRHDCHRDAMAGFAAAHV
jgi:hypothetical protein